MTKKTVATVIWPEDGQDLAAQLRKWFSQQTGLCSVNIGFSKGNGDGAPRVLVHGTVEEGSRWGFELWLANTSTLAPPEEVEKMVRNGVEWTNHRRAEHPDLQVHEMLLFEVPGSLPVSYLVVVSYADAT